MGRRRVLRRLFAELGDVAGEVVLLTVSIAKIIEQFQLHISSQFYSEWRATNSVNTAAFCFDYRSVTISVARR